MRSLCKFYVNLWKCNILCSCCGVRMITVAIQRTDWSIYREMFCFLFLKGITCFYWGRLYREYHPQQFILQKHNRPIYLSNCFFWMLAVIFMRTAADIADLISLSRTSESCKEKVLSLLHFLKCRKLDKNFRNNSYSILKKVK